MLPNVVKCCQMSKVSKPDCRDVPRQSCQDVVKHVPKDVPHQVCDKVEVKKCSPVPQKVRSLLLEEETDIREGKGRRCYLEDVLECRTSQLSARTIWRKEHPFWEGGGLEWVWTIWSSIFMKNPCCQASVLLLIHNFKSSWCCMDFRCPNSSDDLCLLFCLFLLLCRIWWSFPDLAWLGPFDAYDVFPLGVFFLYSRMICLRNLNIYHFWPVDTRQLQ